VVHHDAPFLYIIYGRKVKEDNNTLRIYRAKGS
ncbi:uncharacterized protein METZ01_LOCUS312555, partial [marine metagenome]